MAGVNWIKHKLVNVIAVQMKSLNEEKTTIYMYAIYNTKVFKVSLSSDKAK